MPADAPLRPERAGGRSVHAGLLLLGFAFHPGPQVTQVRAAEATISVQAPRVMLPLATEDALEASRLDADAARGTSSLLVEVNAPEGSGGWVLYLRADRPVFTAEGSGKPCTDLEWKLDSANTAEYRALDDHETVVLENPAGGNARIALDVRVVVGWRTDPGTYGLGLVFRVGSY